jgi:hypothetical protein
VGEVGANSHRTITPTPKQQFPFPVMHLGPTGLRYPPRLVPILLDELTLERFQEIIRIQWFANFSICTDGNINCQHACRDWKKWGPCTVTCDNGWRIRKRTCITFFNDIDRKPCLAHDEEEEPCVKTPCERKLGRTKITGYHFFFAIRMMRVGVFFSFRFLKTFVHFIGLSKVKWILGGVHASL